MVVADEAQFQTLPAAIASARAYLAQAHGDVLATVRYGQQALDLLPEDDYLQRGIAASLLGVAYYAIGDLEMAHHTLAEGIADLQTAGNLLCLIPGSGSWTERSIQPTTWMFMILICSKVPRN